MVKEVTTRSAGGGEREEEEEECDDKENIVNIPMKKATITKGKLDERT